MSADDKLDAIIQKAISDGRKVKCSVGVYLANLREWKAAVEEEIQAAEEMKSEEESAAEEQGDES
jgi:hypothetical protein